MKHMVNRLFSKTRIPASSGNHSVSWADRNDCMGSAEADGTRIAEVAHHTCCSSDPRTKRANSDTP